jgi:superfamily I DNA/RNA helicase
MNTASAALLKQLADPAAGPWVVGDVRQSIYRFRGASPLNMSRFADAFPGADFKDLEVNYRSGGRIVGLFERYGRTMAAAAFASTKELSPHRGKDTGEVAYRVATEREAEAEGLAQEILARRAQPGGYSQHAVLARTHGVLSTLAAHFEHAGVPALYFGDFFERPEVRDLLSLISVAGERDGLGLLRVAQFPRYATPVPDILEMFRFRQEADITMLGALKRANEASLSAEGRAGLQRLAAPCQALFFLSQFQRVNLETASFAGQCRNAVANICSTSLPAPLWSRRRASRIDFVGSPKGRRHLDPKTSASQDELYVNRLYIAAVPNSVRLRTGSLVCGEDRAQLG